MEDIKKKDGEEEYEIIETPPEIVKLLDHKKSDDKNKHEVRGVLIGPIKVPMSPKEQAMETLRMLNNLLKTKEGVSVFLRYMDLSGINKIVLQLSKYSNNPDESMERIKKVGLSYITECEKNGCNNLESILGALVVMGSLIHIDNDPSPAHVHNCDVCSAKNECPDFVKELKLKRDRI